MSENQKKNWDITLICKVPKYRLVLVCGHVAHKKNVFISDMGIFKGPLKHAVLQQDLKISKNLILRSKFESFVRF